MKVIEYGVNNSETIMMLHGGGLSWWNFRDEAELLQEKYHIVLPVIDGHAESGAGFVSIESNADSLIEYIKEHCNGRIKALCGLSLGAQVVVEMISKDNDICEFAMIESVSLILSKFTEKLIKPAFSMSYSLISKKWFSKLQCKSLHIKDSLYEDYYRDTCLVSKENMISFLKANTRYMLKDSFSNTNAKIRVIVGEKEQKSMIQSAKLLSESTEKFVLEIKDGLYHGEFSLNQPQEYVKELIMMIKGE